MVGVELTTAELYAFMLALVWLFSKADIIALWCIVIIKIIREIRNNE